MKPFPQALEIRQKKFEKLSLTKSFDLLVVGGGTHGAFVARSAARRGKSVLLIEASDYASGTSSRSSKLLHGGVRYLEQGNVSLVAKAIRERANMLELAPHLARVCPFLFCVKKGKTKPAFLVRIGLMAYAGLNSLVTSKGAESFATNAAFEKVGDYSQAMTDFGLEHGGLLRYADGQMNDARIVIESISDAETHGAVTLNYCSLSTAERSTNGWTVTVEDSITEQSYVVSAECIANLTGPAVKRVHEECFKGEDSVWKENWPRPVFSTGVHLYFDIDWPYPGLIIPAERKNRYYFVLPLFSAYKKGVLVGTTDVRTSVPNCQPEPTKAEVDLLFSFLERDLPTSGLNRDSLSRTISGTRAMASFSKDNDSPVSEVSRNEELMQSDGYLTLLGGKWTTSRDTAERIVDALLGETENTEIARLPGSLNFEQCKELTGLSEEQSAAVARFGSVALELFEREASIEEAQVDHCIQEEQAVFSKDIFDIRLGLENLSDNSEVINRFNSIISKKEE